MARVPSKKKARGSGSGSATRPADKRFRAPAEWQGMLADLEAQHKKHERVAQKRKGYLFRRRHTDDFRELRIKEVQPERYSEALLELTAQAFATRNRQAEGQRHVLDTQSGARTGVGTGKDVQREADLQVAKQKRLMRKKGIAESDHYYLPTQRKETGEIDRTYEVDGGKGRRRGGGSPARLPGPSAP